MQKLGWNSNGLNALDCLIRILNSSDAGDGIFRLWGVNTMSADALAPKVARASAGIVLPVLDRQHVLLFHSQFHLLGIGQISQIQDTIENVNVSFVIVKAIQLGNS